MSVLNFLITIKVKMFMASYINLRSKIEISNEKLTSFVATVGRGLLLLLLFCGVTNASSQPLPPASIKLRLLDGPEVSCPAHKMFLSILISSYI